jgi:hypothetical protein
MIAGRGRFLVQPLGALSFRAPADELRFMCAGVSQRPQEIESTQIDARDRSIWWRKA